MFIIITLLFLIIVIKNANFENGNVANNFNDFGG